MSSPVRARRVAVALLLLFARPAPAEPLSLDLRTSVARARERAPEAIAAAARIGEARARRAGAAIRFTQNPELEVGGGARLGDPRSLALEARIAQSLELGRRGPRIDAAEAGLAHAQAVTEAELRGVTFAVADAFLDARVADLAIDLAQRTTELATRAAGAAERRRKAGDITDLDVNLAKVALGRSRSALEAARAERADAVGRLGALVGARPDDAITLVGDLRPEPLALDALRAGVPARADVRAIDAEARAARAEGALAAATGRPDLGLWASYQLDETDSIVLGGLSVTLPLWNRAQGDKAVARAKLRQAERERAAVVGAASRQLADAFEAYLRARDALEVFEHDVVPALADSEALLEKSIDAGQIAVADYLVARQQILDGRREHLERQRQLARSAFAVRFVAGVTP